ncbi:MAG: hypothetical protein HQ568_10945 [Calditrichaeota bacterium]|nr:hypothetical protein [Calditrichota bacterium]
MTFSLFKKKITAEEMATGLYHATVSNTVKEDLKDQDGNVMLTKKEQSLMLAQHLYDLLEQQNFKKAKLYLLITYVVNNHKIKDNNDLTFEMAISLDAIEKARIFFKAIPPESHKFIKQKFLFDKDLNPIQKTLVMSWYVSQREIIDSAFESGMKKFKVVDEE